MKFDFYDVKTFAKTENYIWPHFKVNSNPPYIILTYPINPTETKLKFPLFASWLSTDAFLEVGLSSKLLYIYMRCESCANRLPLCKNGLGFRNVKEAIKSHDSHPQHTSPT